MSRSCGTRREAGHRLPVFGACQRGRILGLGLRPLTTRRRPGEAQRLLLVRGAVPRRRAAVRAATKATMRPRSTGIVRVAAVVAAPRSMRRIVYCVLRGASWSGQAVQEGGALPAELAAHEGDKYNAQDQGDASRPIEARVAGLRSGCSNPPWTWRDASNTAVPSCSVDLDQERGSESPATIAYPGASYPALTRPASLIIRVISSIVSTRANKKPRVARVAF